MIANGIAFSLCVLASFFFGAAGAFSEERRRTQRNTRQQVAISILIGAFMLATAFFIER